jgi:hypothetical protein
LAFSTLDGTTGSDPRYAVCNWVAENVEHLQTFVPYTYPRGLYEEKPYNDNPIFWIAMSFGVFVALCVLLMGVVTYIFRNEVPFKVAQLPFLYIILLGLLGVSSRAVVYGLQPRPGTCLARTLLVNMGYILEFLPMEVKIAAINQMLQAAKTMRRVTISRCICSLSLVAFALSQRHI